MMEACDVMVLCGGLGTRLRKVVADRPKPMADIDGAPFLSRLLEHVSSHGFQRFILCVGHKSDVIESHFRRSCGDLSVVLSNEESPLGTGGAIWNARTLIKSRTFLALNGDSFCPVDYAGMLEFHSACRSSATLAVAPIQEAGEYGTVLLADNGRINAFAEKSGRQEPGLVNAGVYAFQTDLLDQVLIPPPFSLERDVFPHVAERGSLWAWKTSGPLIDIGTPERYLDAQTRLTTLMSARKPADLLTPPRTTGRT